ncbi:flavin-containing monooxygenase [Mycolicibacterium peregrinum]
MLRYAFGLLGEAVFIWPLLRPKYVMPWVHALEKAGRRYIRREVSDPDLVRKLTPQYGFGCKRPTMSNTYLGTFNRSNVELVTDAIVRITEVGVETADGSVHEFDTLVLGTGFKILKADGTPPLPIRGRGGVDLGEHWDATRYKAYHGVSVPGFPNMFIAGWAPYGLAGPSYIFTVETNVQHIMRCLLEARRRGAVEVEVGTAAHDRYFDHISKKSQSTAMIVNNCGGSNSYYQDRHGDASVIRPDTSATMWLKARIFPLSDYRYTPAADVGRQLVLKSGF